MLAFQFAFNNQQDFSSQPGISQLPSGPLGLPSGQMGFESQQFGKFAPNFPNQPGFGDMGGFDSQFTGIPESGYGNQKPPQFLGAPQAPQQNYGTPPQQNYGTPPQQNYGAPPQQNYGTPPQQNYGAPPQQNYGMPPQQNFAPPQGNPASGRPRWQDGQQGPASFSPEQVPFPGPGNGNGYKG